MHTRKEKADAFIRLLDILDELREKCPWDRKQTNESLRGNTIEEVYELNDALIQNDIHNICKELGDVLLHVLFYAKIGSETEDFDIVDVCERLTEKLIFRHPHVFSNPQNANMIDADGVSQQWEVIKQKEKDGNKTILSGVPATLPSLIKSFRIQEKVSNVGFDWSDRNQVWEKVKEEISEFEHELECKDSIHAEEECGDLLFSLVNAARLFGINPDNALEKSNRKFIRRFNYVESSANSQGKVLKQMSLEEMEQLWKLAKAQEKSNNV